MSVVNVVAREVACKIVFYGPGLSGKTTSLKRVYETVKPQHRGEMMSLATEGDRTLFFDFLPIKVERVGDCAVRLALYTVPGQVFYNATRKHVLQGADGVVFVADSQPEAQDSNRESLANLEENLAEQGIRLDRFPLVIQYNKRDIPKALPVEQMRASLNPRGVPDFETCAMTGRGILDALKAITRLVIKDLRAKRIVPAPRTAAPAPTGGADAGLEEQLQQHIRSRPAGMGPPSTPDAPLARPAPQPAPGAHPVSPPAAAPQTMATPASARAARPVSPASGPLTAIAPRELVDYARAVESAFAGGEYVNCVLACQEAVRRALAHTGEASMAAQAYFLKIDGPDLLRLQSLGSKANVRAEDAAFAIYVVMQAFARLNPRAGV